MAFAQTGVDDALPLRDRPVGADEVVILAPRFDVEKSQLILCVLSARMHLRKTALSVSTGYRSRGLKGPPYLWISFKHFFTVAILFACISISKAGSSMRVVGLRLASAPRTPARWRKAIDV